MRSGDFFIPHITRIVRLRSRAVPVDPELRTRLLSHKLRPMKSTGKKTVVTAAQDGHAPAEPVDYWDDA